LRALPSLARRSSDNVETNRGQAYHHHSFLKVTIEVPKLHVEAGSCRGAADKKVSADLASSRSNGTSIRIGRGRRH
jgi:hypothetical protein